jgi:hypothetical protein
MSEHRSLIRSAPAGGFTVTIEPPLESENFDGAYPTHKAAFGYAIGLRMVRGWPVVDLASDAHLLDILTGGAK